MENRSSNLATLGGNTMKTDVKTQTYVPTKDKARKLHALFCEVEKEDRLRFVGLPGVTTNWSPAKMVLLYNYRANKDETTQQEIADVLGIDRSAVSRKDNGMNWYRFEQELEMLCSMTKEEAIKHAATFQSKKNDEKTAKKERQSLITREAFYADLKKSILEANKYIAIKTDVPPPVRPKGKNISSPEHVVLLLSDMHVGLDFSAADTGGANAYNVDIMQRRMDGLKRGLASIYRIHSQAYSMPVLHIFALGDMVQGGNLQGEWGGAYNSPYVHLSRQAATVASSVGSLIEFSKSMFDQIDFVGVVGNHGRAGVSKNSDRVGANWDNQAYMFLGAKFENDPRVHIDYDMDTWWKSRSVLGTEFLLIHGDHMGNNPTSILQNNQKLQEIVLQTSGKSFNILCLAHFHSHFEKETTMGRVIINGSFVGADIHSLHHMRAGSRPTQTILGVHPEHGMTWKYCLDLDKTEKKECKSPKTTTCTNASVAVGS
jgi:hypothetical protein